MYTPLQTRIFHDLMFWHSGIIVKDLASGANMLLQYEALFFEPSNILLPRVSDDKFLIWNNTAVVGWLNEPDMKQFTTKVKMGTVSGTVLNKWFDWVHGFAAIHQGYTLFSIWNKAGLIPAERHEFHEDSMCHRFSENGLNAFVEKGADFSAVKQPLCRNYFAVVKDSGSIATVNRDSGHEWRKVVDYFSELNSLVKKLGKPKSSKQWIAGMKEIFAEMANKYGSVGYVADSSHDGQYHKVRTVEPHVAYVIQRMKLSWQGAHSGINPLECVMYEGAAMPESFNTTIVV